MKAQSGTREHFLRALAGWSLVFWAAIYGLLTARSFVLRPDLPMLSLAGLRLLMMPIGLVVCAVLFVSLERISRLDGFRQAGALCLALALATLLYFTVNYYVFHSSLEHEAPELNALIKIVSYLIEFFWIFPAWVLLYLILRWRLGPAPAAPLAAAPEGIWIKDRGAQILVRADSIRWIEAERDYARIHTDRGSHLVRSTMAALERRLSAFHFLRIHRRFIAPSPAIRAMTRSRDGRVTLTLEDGTCLPAGRAYLPRLKNILAENPQGSSEQG